MILDGFRRVTAGCRLIIENLCGNDFVVREFVIPELVFGRIPGVVKAGVTNINATINDGDFDLLASAPRAAASLPGLHCLD